jgi:hypothetical protein
VKLDEALQQSPAKEAGNDSPAQGVYSIVGARLLADGQVEVDVYIFEGEIVTQQYADAEQANARLFSDIDGAKWDGDDTWYPRQA